MSDKKRLIVLSSPSGGGKSTLAKVILDVLPNARFSISATTRAPRPGETDGVHYYFLTREEFQRRALSGEMAEYEEIFGNCYGTLRAATDDAIRNGEVLLFDVDVKGAFSLRRAFPDCSLLIFIAPPSVEVLEQRLRARSTETEEQLQKRLARAEMELAQSKDFDCIVVNDDLETAKSEMAELIKKYFEGDE